MLSHAIMSAVSRWPLPPELLTFFLAMLPVVEMRGAIPFALGVLKLSWISAFAWSYVGSLLPGLIVLRLAEPVINWCSRKSAFCNRIIGKTLNHTREHFAKKHERFGELFLLAIVSVPFPGFGVWTGALAAVVFGVPRPKAAKLMALGNLVACAIVLLASEGVIKLAAVL